MPSEEINFDVYHKGQLIDHHYGKIAKVMKGRKDGPWHKVRLACRDYKVLHSERRGNYIDIENFLPSNPGSRTQDQTAWLSGRRRR